MEQTPAGAYLLRKNHILREAMLTAPLAVCADSAANALMLCFLFGTVTFLTLLISRAVPQRMLFSFRILSYSVIAALVYAPAALSAAFLFPASSGSIHAAVLASGLYLAVRQETLFPRDGTPLLIRTGQTVCVILGVFAVILSFGILRELLGYGTLSGTVCFAAPPLPILQTPAAGLLMTAVFCIITEKCCSRPEPAQ